MADMRIAPRLLAGVVLIAATASCGDVVRSGRSPVFLVMDSLTGASSGANTMLSDVAVMSPAPCSQASPCVENDLGEVQLRLVPKNIDVLLTSNNEVTISRYHISFRRADGRNTPGVDVPYGWDGAVTAGVSESGTAIVFELVRHVTKNEPPLVQLRSNPSIIHTIAEVTFYGTDLVGNAVSATGSMSIEFGNFPD
jgi:hypothetical protein